MAGGMVTIAGITRFVSDLHLRPERPDLTERFSRFLVDCAEQQIDALFILGDLFEYWIGDDNLDDPFVATIVAALRQLSDRGTKLYFVHGNRDFLIGHAFAAATGATLLPDLTVLKLGAVPVGAGDTPQDNLASIRTSVLLLHGDTLCTDDHAYQNFRRRVRAPEWQQQFLAQSLRARRAEVATLRRHSAEAIREKSAEIMDVSPNAVRQTLATSMCRVMIHGHTHRPGREVIDATTGSERWVLSDWEYERGDALELNGQKLCRLDWSR